MITYGAPPTPRQSLVISHLFTAMHLKQLALFHYSVSVHIKPKNSAHIKKKTA